MYARVILVGRLGKDPEMRYTPAGVPVTSFNVATDRRWTGPNGEPQEKTTWFRVTCWRKLAELTAQYCRKGQLVLIEADSIDASTWTDREGTARASLEITARDVRFLSSRAEGAAEGAPAGGGRAVPPSMGDEPLGNEDEIPF